MTRFLLLLACFSPLGALAQTEADGGLAARTVTAEQAPDAGVMAAPPVAPPAATLTSAKKSEPLHVAVLRLRGTSATEAQAEPVTALLATKLAENKALKVVTDQDIAALIGLERQKQLLGTECTEGSSCFTELAGAIGAQYLVTGRLDRFGDKWTLTTTLFDAHKSEPLSRTRDDADDEGELPEAAEKAAVSVMERLEVRLDAAQKKQEEGRTGADISVKIGPTFIEGISALSPSADLVLGYRFDPAWVGFLQIGVTIVRREGGKLDILPTVLGAKHFYRVGKSFQPYWGIGLGVQLAIGPFGIFERVGPLPSVLGMLGFSYFVKDWIGVGLEGSTNVAQTVLGLSLNDTSGSFNLQPSLTVTFRP